MRKYNEPEFEIIYFSSEEIRTNQIGPSDVGGTGGSDWWGTETTDLSI